MKKHVGLIENTGQRCVVVFREIYDENGNVIEPDKCLVVETDNLPDFAYQDIVSIIESGPAQNTANLYEVLARTRFSDNSIVLQWLHNNNRLRKYDTSNIVMKPTPSYSIKLNKLNRIIHLQKSGYSEKDIERIIEDDTDKSPRTKDLTESVRENTINNEVNSTQGNQPSIQNEGVLDDESLAKNYLSQAKTLSDEAERLTNEAYNLAPQLKPKTTRTRASSTTKTSSTKNKSTSASSKSKTAKETKGETT